VLYISLARATPLVTLVLFLFLSLPTLGINLDKTLAAIVALTLNTSAFNAEIWRNAFRNFPREQREAAESVGMRRWTYFRYIMLPQMWIESLPALVNEMSFLIKGSPAIAVIGVAAKYLHPEIDSLYAMPIFLQDMNPWLAGLVTTSLVASIFVSVSTVALAIASLVVKDFYVPYRNPTPEQEFKATRWMSLLIGFLPLIFVLLVPEVLKLSFFTRAIRLSITVVAVIAFYAPFFKSTRGANAGLIGACVVTSLWYLLGDPFGINNMYIALITPAVIMVLDRLIPNKADRKVPAPVQHNGV